MSVDPDSSMLNGPLIPRGTSNNLQYTPFSLPYALISSRLGPFRQILTVARALRQISTAARALRQSLALHKPAVKFYAPPGPLLNPPLGCYAMCVTRYRGTHELAVTAVQSMHSSSPNDWSV